jgi:hypothetical protein
MDVNGYLIYWHKDTKHTVWFIELDNRWVVLHNVYLSTKYDAHINVDDVLIGPGVNPLEGSPI